MGLSPPRISNPCVGLLKLLRGDGAGLLGDFMWRTGTNLNHEKKFYLMTAARRGLRAQVPSINLCGQNRNLPAPARRGSTWKVPRARDAHVTRIVCDIVSFLSSMPRPRSFLHGAGLGLGMADDKETKLTAHGTRIVGDVDVAMDLDLTRSGF